MYIYYLCIYTYRVDTEKQRQRRRDNVRLTESARSEQLLVMPTESLTNREWLPGELLSVSECRRPGWFLDMKYQTCLAQEMGSCLAVDAKRYLLVLEYRYRWNVGGLSSITAEVRCLHFA